MSVIFFAGRGLTKLDEAELKELDDWAEETITVDENPDAPQIADGVEVGATYRCAELTFFSFPHWRACRDWVIKLADMVGCTDELLKAGSAVAFRDFFMWKQEGTVGPKASAKLAVEFAEWDERAKSFADHDFYEMFAFMRTMFEWGAKDGLIYLRSA
ncbi:hypothetical protein LGM42_04895 [Burkholderia sp. AU39826]|uniref:hypothetical protein n=1 Tax=Burkholderia sp. AU39826 TaxID=2879634 RepID=UPI001CF5D280|nr:hypothetical protein [Burkholderia sp. AU39826]MCA7969229.1 hypothetical protein [Burkholderia sp. AU39826]